MEVSHFELIYKAQAPADAAGVDVDTVIQGYFLEITNLESFPCRYAVEFVAVPPPAGQPNRSLSGNTVTFVDSPGTDNQAGVLQQTLFRPNVYRPSTGLIRVEPQATALLAVLPSVFPVPVDPTPLTQPNFEVRGFVRIRLPAVRREPPLFPFPFQPQAADPVRVLLTPQNRASFISAATGTISDQAQASLPTASGAALNLVPPEQGLVFGRSALPPAAGLARAARMLEEAPELADPGLLTVLIIQAESADKGMESCNELLEEAGSRIRITRAASEKDRKKGG
jgi:hypothetical protein